MATLRGARSHLRRQLREQQRLRLATLVLATLLVLGALPLYLGIRSATRDPVFTSLDALAVPGWAAGDRVDVTSGSRWCFIDCRFRERTVHSERGPQETGQAYQAALASAGWEPWKVALCPEQPLDGSYTCWRREELTLDLWVRKPACPVDSTTRTPGADPAPPAAGVAPPVGGAARCDGSTVSFKVRNAVDDDRRRPQPALDPNLTGEDPDPVISLGPLPGATPAPS
ncbi:MAG TPA: hypothetical protein VF755_26635 [Catenuloplanes sp.]